MIYSWELAGGQTTIRNARPGWGVVLGGLIYLPHPTDSTRILVKLWKLAGEDIV
jgi:hypothetical protein